MTENRYYVVSCPAYLDFDEFNLSEHMCLKYGRPCAECEDCIIKNDDNIKECFKYGIEYIN